MLKLVQPSWFKEKCICVGIFIKYFQENFFLLFLFYLVVCSYPYKDIISLGHCPMPSSLFYTVLICVLNVHISVIVSGTSSGHYLLFVLFLSILLKDNLLISRAMNISEIFISGQWAMKKNNVNILSKLLVVKWLISSPKFLCLFYWLLKFCLSYIPWNQYILKDAFCIPLRFCSEGIWYAATTDSISEPWEKAHLSWRRAVIILEEGSPSSWFIAWKFPVWVQLVHS